MNFRFYGVYELTYLKIDLSSSKVIKQHEINTNSI